MPGVPDSSVRGSTNPCFTFSRFLAGSFFFDTDDDLQQPKTHLFASLFLQFLLPYNSLALSYPFSLLRMMKLQALLLVVMPAFAMAFAPSQGSVAFARPTRATATSAARKNSPLASAVAPELAEGILKTISKIGQGLPVKMGDIATVRYTCYLPDDVDAKSTLPFAKSSKQKMVIGDGTMIDGWEKAIRSMRIGERSVIRITNPAMAYGVAGVPPLVPSNAVVEMDMEILDSQPASMNIDFDSLAMADSTPRTANDIARAYQQRQDAKPDGPELEGLEMWIEKAKSFYFFGLFEGETGEKAPWFLRPSITFPLAFAIVGAAFWVSFAGGAINTRGAQVTDELDEIVLSSTMLKPSAQIMLASMNTLFSSTVVDV